MKEEEIRELEEAYQTDYELGQDNLRILGMDLHNPVFFVSAFLILAFVVGTLVAPDQASALMEGSKNWIIEHFDWLFMLAGNIFVVFCLVLIFLPIGRIRLGGQDARPEFTTLSWFAMLFAAGMGIGLMFWSVAEPVGYFTDWFGTPLNVGAGGEESARLAMGAAMFHWGLHPWAIYGLVALALAFFAYNKDMPLTIRSAFYPLLGDWVWGRVGDLIDIFAVLATLFGLATSLGLGVKQAGGGLHYLLDIPNSINLQIGIIVGVTAVALVSVVRGVHGGVRLLSNLNMMLAGLLLVFVIVTGSTLAMFGWMGETALSYVQNMLPLSNWVGREDQDFLHDWTVFYWAWWISWSPFVGMFIARVSRGRTVREFMTAVLLVPTVITVIWMGAFGGSAIEQVMAGTGSLASGISSVDTAMFEMLDQLPLAAFTASLAIFLVLVFFVTSSDSGSLVIDSITSGGKVDAPVAQRVFWATMEGLIAGTLLFGGGEQALKALQAGAISTGLPFTIVLLLMCVSVVKGLYHEHLILRFRHGE